MFRAALLISTTLLSACATIVNGGSQTVTLSTTPPGAACTVDRMGARVGAVAQTPGSLRVEKSKNNLMVTCSKPGFQTATVTKPPSFGRETFGNIVAGGVIGAVVDAASGANYRYPGDIRLDMVAEPAPAPPSVASHSPVLAPDAAVVAAAPVPPRRRAAPRIQPVTATPITATPVTF